MSLKSLEHKALSLLAALERAGKTVNRITVSGQRLEFELSKPENPDEFEGIDMRHGKA